MAAVVDIRIINQDGDRFDFRAVTALNYRSSQPPVNVALPSLAGGNSNYIFRFIGEVETISFQFAIFNDGADVSGGSGIVTVPAQIDHLLNTVKTSAFDKNYAIYDLNALLWSGAKTGVIVDLDVDPPKAGATLVTGRLSFMVGQISTG